MSRSALVFIALAFLPILGSVAQQPPPSAPMAAELVRQEQTRSAVEQALELYLSPVDGGLEETENMVRAVDDLVRVGPETVPFVVEELERADPRTFFFSAYALGRLGTAAAERALRQAIEVAEGQRGEWPLTRKGWAAYGLGLIGASDAVGILYEGRHLAGTLPMHGGMNAIEVTALHTQPDCVPVLLEMVDKLAGDPDLRTPRITVVQAMSHVPDATMIPKLKELIEKEEDRNIRLAAIAALAGIRTPEAIQATLEALADPMPLVRRSAALLLEQHQIEFPPDVVIDRLEVEEDQRVRDKLLVLLVQRLGASAIDWMSEHWEAASAVERSSMLSALQESPTPEALPLLERALRDPNNRVVTRAVLALGDVGNRQAVKRLRLAVHSPAWSVARTAVEQLVKLRRTDAAETIAERLLKVELYREVRQPEFRYRPELLVNAVTGLGYTKVLPGLKRATEKQTDPVLLETLRRNIEQLEAMEANGDDLERWIEASRSPNREIRDLAYGRIAEIGGDQAAQTLVGAFGRVEADEGMEILRAAGEMSEEPILALLDRVLNGPEFDSVDRWPLRDMAAWSARRIGNERMQESLRAAVERRNAKDASVLVYYMLAGGKSALPTYEKHRLSRMRYRKWSRGRELNWMDRMARRIEAGRSLAQFELPPEKLDYR